MKLVPSRHAVWVVEAARGWEAGPRQPPSPCSWGVGGAAGFGLENVSKQVLYHILELVLL